MIALCTPPGTSVVCINAIDRPELVEGQRYTVMRMQQAMASDGRIAVGVLLREVPDTNIAFDRSRFRRAELPECLLRILWEAKP